MLQRCAMWCSVFQCVPVCATMRCSVLQCAAVFCSVFCRVDFEIVWFCFSVLCNRRLQKTDISRTISRHTSNRYFTRNTRYQFAWYHTCVYPHTQAQVCLCVSECVCVCVWVGGCRSVFVCVCVCAGVCVCMYVNVYVKYKSILTSLFFLKSLFILEIF